MIFPSRAAVGRPVIRNLEPHLINQIAAGEVVERPASVVKELVENALDAGATEVHVTWRQGGHSQIRIQDNGWGMTREDMILALQRHTTSKLPDGDLHAITTFGFRGEALAAIASVARVTLSSRPAEHVWSGHLQSAEDNNKHQVKIDDSESVGWQMRVEGGHVVHTQPVPMGVGTVIEVCDLFYAVPARLKFMRSAAVEHGHMIDVLQRTALVHPDVKFVLSYDGRTRVWDVGLAQRLKDILGIAFYENHFGFDASASECTVRGWMSVPTFHRSTPSHQFFFVNGRPVRDSLLGAAVKTAYGDTVVHGRHSMGVLLLDVPLTAVDVNVHPAKTQVRFRDGRWVRGFVVGALRQHLRTHAQRVSTVLPASWVAGRVWIDQEAPLSSLAPLPAMVSHTLTEGHDKTTSLTAEWDRLGPENFDQVGVALAHPSAVDSCSWMLHEQHDRLALPPSSMVLSPSPPAPSSCAVPPSSLPLLSISAALCDHHPGNDLSHGLTPGALGTPWGQVQGGYIIAHSLGSLVIVDPHAAHERIVFEAMKQDWKQDLGLGQPLLLGVPVALTWHECILLRQHQVLLACLGFVFEGLSDDQENQSVTVRQMPRIFQAYDVQAIVQEVLACVHEGDDDPGACLLAMRNRMMANWACRQSITLGQSLSLPEMTALLRTVEQTPNSAQCNHGRPVYRILTAKALQDVFERR